MIFAGKFRGFCNTYCARNTLLVYSSAQKIPAKIPVKALGSAGLQVAERGVLGNHT